LIPVAQENTSAKELLQVINDPSDREIVFGEIRRMLGEPAKIPNIG